MVHKVLPASHGNNSGSVIGLSRCMDKHTPRSVSHTKSRDLDLWMRDVTDETGFAFGDLWPPVYMYCRFHYMCWWSLYLDRHDHWLYLQWIREDSAHSKRAFMFVSGELFKTFVENNDKNMAQKSSVFTSLLIFWRKGTCKTFLGNPIVQKKNRKKNAITFCYDYVECQITQNETLLDVPHYDRAGHKSAILMRSEELV